MLGRRAEKRGAFRRRDIALAARAETIAAPFPGLSGIQALVLAAPWLYRFLKLAGAGAGDLDIPFNRDGRRAITGGAEAQSQAQDRKS